MKILNIIQILVAILLIVSILLQNRGAGLSGVFGGEGGYYRSRRGFEKKLFILTIILSVIFFAIAMANLIY